ncbi:TIGR03745 family integrating conjugative element membrane protein [Xanthomonas sacchari]|uniref:TIGR03745 family integrating conjugative element membrane protein n=1 Tax=Xanthomonas sp. SHU 308 TaxID=1591201 RepID=UPI000B45400D|nr:TIGR03745 family integrating conjugative element membrane protein [Xanthomonas sp. SHU 308]
MQASTLPRRRATRTVPILATATLLAIATPAFAVGLPTMEDPSRGAGKGILQTLQNYGYDIVLIVALLVALLVVASMFVGVCYHAYTRYSEIHTGRATWGQFGLTVAVGAMLLVVGIWLLTKATAIL